MDHECNHQPTTMTTMVHGDDKEQGKRPGKGAQTTTGVVWAPGMFYFPFLCILLKFLFIFSSYIYDYQMESPHSPTKVHEGPTQDNEVPRRPTQAHAGQRGPT